MKRANLSDKIKQMNIKEATNYWVKSSEEDLKTAKSLFDSKRYAHCLFFCHLFIEKILKALIVKSTKDNPLPIHSLPRLSKDTRIILSNEQMLLLDEINEFNIRGRYNDIKFRFYKRATSEFTKKYFDQAKKLYLWLKKKL